VKILRKTKDLSNIWLLYDHFNQLQILVARYRKWGQRQRRIKAELKAKVRELTERIDELERKTQVSGNI